MAELILVIGIIYFFDPYQIFHISFFHNGKAYGKSIPQLVGIINNYPFDSVILGSSMLQNTSAEEANKKLGGNFVNLSFGDSNFLKRILPLGIKQVVFSLDENILLFPRFGHSKRKPNDYNFLLDKNFYNDFKVYFNIDFIQKLFSTPTNTVSLPDPWINEPNTKARFGGWEN